MTRPVFSEDDRRPLRRERFEHPHPRVPLRREVLWRISCGESYSSAARRTDVSDATVDRNVALSRARGFDGLKQFDGQGPTSELVAHQTSREEAFRARPPHTIAEACQRLAEATGIQERARNHFPV